MNLFKNISQKILKNIIFYLFAVIAIFCLMYQINRILTYFTLEDYFYDFHWRWQECAYTLKGINPIDIAKGIVPIDTEIGSLPSFAGTVPWAYILGNVFVFGFLPYPLAEVIGIITFPIIAIITGYSGYKFFLKKTNSKKYGLIALILVFCNPYWATSFLGGNSGAIASCLLLMMVINIEKRPYLAGVLLSLATIKPQLALVFWLALLLQKRWKTFNTGLVIIMGSWVASAFITQTSPIKMLLETNSQGVDEYLNGYFGFFRIFIDAGYITRQQSLFYSAIFGTVLIFLFSFLILKNTRARKSNFLYYAVPAVVSTFWFYKQEHDYFVIIILAYAALEIISMQKFKKHSTVILPILLFIYFIDQQLINQIFFNYLLNFTANFHYLVLFVQYFLLYFVWIFWLLLVYLLFVNYKTPNLLEESC